MSEIRPERDYPELSTICPNEMRYGTKSIVGNTAVLHPKRTDKSISRLHTDRDVCKGSTDTPKNATQGCSATLKLDKGSSKPALMATSEDGTQRKEEPHEIHSWEYVRSSDRKKIRRFAMEGKSRKEIAKELHCAKSTIDYNIRLYGLIPLWWT